ncbi:curli-like amyloid fiber formation chaperone CsgH [Pseudoponticoccus marisrubri]|nr:curli-like amyloid fiber formation chaperone CsgH [Pseudoponticoccus marisrubri]
MTPSDTGLSIRAGVAGEPGREVEGRLSISRKSNGNSMATTQSRTVVLPEEGEAFFGRVDLNLGPQAVLVAELTLLENGRELGRATLDIDLQPGGQD